MKHRSFYLLLMLVLTFGLVCAASAQETYTFELTEAFSFKEENEHWSIDISLPKVSGMADEDEQARLNDYILSKKDIMLEDYNQNVVFGERASKKGMIRTSCTSITGIR